MKFFAIASILLAPTCFASDSSSMSMLSSKQFSSSGIRGYAIAIGLSLGTSSEMVIKDASNNQSVSLLVCTKKLKDFVLATRGCEEVQDFNPIAELFDCNCLLEKLRGTWHSGINLFHAQSLFLECARIPEAKITIDVAILKWLSGVIQEAKFNAHLLVDVRPSILSSICALSWDPDDKLFNFTKDILTVLAHVLRLITMAGDLTSKRLLIDSVLPTLLTVIKLTDDGPIRNLAMLIATTFYNEDYKRTGPIILFCLGRDHIFVKSIDTKFVGEVDQASWNDQLELQLTFNRKLHSLVKLPCLDSNDNFMLICYSQVLKASITTNDSLEWESSQAQRQILWLEKSAAGETACQKAIIRNLPD